MPEGQFSGQRAAYLYTSDSDDVYIITTDKTLGDLAETGLVAATTANIADATVAPKRFKPRVAFWQGSLENRPVRKALVCNRTSDLIEATAPTAITIDGVAGSTTGRRGEKLSYPSLPAGAAAPPDGGGDGGGGGGAPPAGGGAA